MPKLEWDNTGERYYETGTKKGVLWVMHSTDEAGAKTAKYGTGVAWNGLTAVTESPSGAEETALYADDIKYLSLRSAEEFGCTIEAYTYPDEFMQCDGSEMPVDGVVLGQQKRATFAFSYVTTVGNDTEGNDFGYKIHIVYGCTASPSERAYATINDSPEAITFSWEVSTIPVNVAGFKPTSLITIDTSKLDTDGKKGLAVLEALLYGGTTSEELKKLEIGKKKSEGDTYYTLEDLLTDPAFASFEPGPNSQLLMPDQIVKIMETGTAAAAG